MGDEKVLSVLLLSRRAQPCQYEDVRREQNERLADLRGADLRGARGSTNQDLDYLRRILTCVFTWTGGAPACSFRTLASSLMAAR